MVAIFMNASQLFLPQTALYAFYGAFGNATATLSYHLTDEGRTECPALSSGFWPTEWALAEMLAAWHPKHNKTVIILSD
ncbi:hypothetical protein JCM17846_05830 [Iodidimonas nitroreducens]|uniref:Uncharacterized protein n=1 Tax=Iodidimonas nitroreducens TaxID=1236968 RepID=A0A5A7N3Q1_9PROT|nr:hypothetical protein JCM17846_05830 [Iodidimonas nitroreducens]